MHKSQGFGSARTRGESLEQFILRAGEPGRAFRLGATTPMGRPGTADEVAAAQIHGAVKLAGDHDVALGVIRSAVTHLAG